MTKKEYEIAELHCKKYNVENAPVRTKTMTIENGIAWRTDSRIGTIPIKYNLGKIKTDESTTIK